MKLSLPLPLPPNRPLTELPPVDTGIIYTDPHTRRKHYAVIVALHDGFAQCRDVRNPRDNSFVAVELGDIQQTNV